MHISPVHLANLVTHAGGDLFALNDLSCVIAYHVVRAMQMRTTAIHLQYKRSELWLVTQVV